MPAAEEASLAHAQEAAAAPSSPAPGRPPGQLHPRSEQVWQSPGGSLHARSRPSWAPGHAGGPHRPGRTRDPNTRANQGTQGLPQSSARPQGKTFSEQGCPGDSRARKSPPRSHQPLYTSRVTAWSWLVGGDTVENSTMQHEPTVGARPPLLPPAPGPSPGDPRTAADRPLQCRPGQAPRRPPACLPSAALGSHGPWGVPLSPGRFLRTLP